MPAFGGFPPETISFLRAVRANNRKDWFDAHPADYLEDPLGGGRRARASEERPFYREATAEVCV